MSSRRARPARAGASCSRPCVRARSSRAAWLRILHVHARDAAAAVAQRREIAGRLRADQLREAERLVGDRELVAVVLDDLQEETTVRATLVQLPGRVEVARADAVRDDAAGRS